MIPFASAIDVVTIASGALVGFLLGLLGGGGSILAVPLLLYAVGIGDTHIAIGTSAVAVAFSAAANLTFHARDGHVRWHCALVFAGCGVVGAFLGARIAQMVDGGRLLLAFAAAMVAVAVSALRRTATEGDANVQLNKSNTRRLVPIGMATGFASGFFGIGGGFLIVPGLIRAANMTFINAVGSSLVAVTAFAAATAASYTVAHLVNWSVAGLFILGGLAGGVAGRAACNRLCQHRNALTRIFACFVFITALYVAWRALNA